LQEISADEPGISQTEWLRNEWEQARLLAKQGEAILVVGNANCGLEDFLMGKKELFLW